jgi:hypothetical protein
MGLPPGEIAPDSAGPAPDSAGPAPESGPASAAGGPAGTGPAVPRARPSTGDARVDEAVARLDDLPRLPLAEHLAVFEYVHERLTEALGDLDVHASARPGDQPSGPGARGG